MDLDKIIAELQKIAEASKAPTPGSDKIVASMAQTVIDSIRQESKNYEDRLLAEKTAKETAAKDLETLKASSEKASAELAEANKKIADLSNLFTAKAAEELFSVRMAALDSEYEFSDADRKLVATDLKAVAGTDEAFASYKERAAVLFAHKNKAAKIEADKAFAAAVEAAATKKIAETSKASAAPTAEPTAKELLASVTEPPAPLASAPSSGSQGKKSWSERFADKGVKHFVEIK